MTDTTLFRINVRLDAVRALEKQAEQWHLNHIEAMRMLDLEDMISDLAQSVEDASTVAHLLYARLGRNQVNEPLLVGDALRKLVEWLEVASRPIQKRTVELEARGYTVEGSAGLKAAIRQIGALAGWLESVWPPSDKLFDPAEMQKAVEEAEAGNLLTHEEVWRDFGCRP